MKLFLIAFTLSSLATIASSWCTAQAPDDSGSQPIKQSRFVTTPAQEYRMEIARQDSAHRRAMLHHYDIIGFNYGQPEINGSVFFLAPPPTRFRRVFVVPNGFGPSPYSNFGMQ